MKKKTLWKAAAGARLLFGTALLVGVGACNIVDPRVCHAGIFYEVTPRDTAIAVGESFTPVATISGCDWSRPLEGEWTAADPSVVSVDRATGRTTGLSPGETELLGRQEDGLPVVSVSVRVVDGG
jgi:hypothetical protein